MSDSASAWFSNGKAIFQLPMGFSLALVGAGYLIGIVGGLAMLFGTFLAWVLRYLISLQQAICQRMPLLLVMP